MLQSRRSVAGPEIEKGNALQSADSHGVKPKCFGPGIEGTREITLITQDPAQQIVSVSQRGISGEATTRHLVGGIELPATAQGFTQLQKCQARRLIHQSGRQGLDVVTHDSSPALPPGFPLLVSSDRPPEPAPLPQGCACPDATNSSRYPLRLENAPAPPDTHPSAGVPPASADPREEPPAPRARPVRTVLCPRLLAPGEAACWGPCRFDGTRHPEPRLPLQPRCRSCEPRRTRICPGDRPGPGGRANHRPPPAPPIETEADPACPLPLNPAAAAWARPAGGAACLPSGTTRPSAGRTPSAAPRSESGPGIPPEPRTRRIPRSGSVPRSSSGDRGSPPRPGPSVDGRARAG